MPSENISESNSNHSGKNNKVEKVKKIKKFKSIVRLKRVNIGQKKLNEQLSNVSPFSTYAASLQTKASIRTNVSAE